ncbi:MAG: hypothetical protein P1P85_03505 [Patescibacteria group bacterium]|nr:hypothetical protein [Patescibacteria group bacterium]
MIGFFIQSVQAAETLKLGGLVIYIGWWSFLFALIKYLFIFVTILFIVAIILIVFRVEGSFKVRLKEMIEEAMEAGRLPKTKVQKEWELIVANLESDSSENQKKAVVGAEELFNKVLKIANFSGSNIEERLRKIPDSQLEFKEDIVWAYKLKKKIKENENFDVETEEVKRAVYIFERALKEMNII